MNDWIELIKNKPPQDEKVLVFCGKYMDVASLNGEIFYDGNIYQVHDVSHWRFLPKSPLECNIDEKTKDSGRAIS